MNFKKWLYFQEAGTSTADVAGFARISIPMVRRGWVDGSGKKKKSYRVPQLDETQFGNVSSGAINPQLSEPEIEAILANTASYDPATVAIALRLRRERLLQAAKRQQIQLGSSLEEPKWRA